ncbi:DUF58 domain-containing protein [Natronococcus occultus]|uniref:DUF58 domain-containing protein n=1 Tax=Natronococcus occultus SP4 TaxID=694430 RepID=L0K257_9EURY|nr:DUF58 domain-containing protein [Natronococcus occultus]AGB38640.1 hypothetical protein Natoc_2882 [Natronococcus occultus SP4]
MRPTRQVWAVGAIAGALAVLAAVFARPLLLGATVLLGAWVLVRQRLFARGVAAAVDSLTVRQVPAANTVRADAEMPVTVEATLGEPARLQLSVEGGVPTGATAAGPLSATLEPGDATTRETTTVTWPVAGRHRFDRPTVTASDGLFTTTIPVESRPTVTVEPRGPHTVHVGRGGDRASIAQGEHDAGQRGPGLEPAELREYVSGDSADEIDWKATARLNTLHVREYETETHRPTMLLVDHRAGLAAGPPGESKLDYLREVALAIAANARDLDDPLGLITVGDEGITSRLDPTTGPAAYLSLRRRLLELEPTGLDDGEVPEAASRTHPIPGPVPTPSRPRAALSALEGTNDSFTRTLEPFYAARTEYDIRFDADPLVGAIRTALSGQDSRQWTIICTDDSDHESLYETIRFARARGSEVLVLLTPTVLFASDGLGDPDRASDRYLEFEELRRDLDRMDAVTAFEVAPEDRLSAVLETTRSRSRGGLQ